MARIAEAVPRGSIVGVDTPAFIYQLEGNPGRASIIQEFFTDVAGGLISVVASVLTLTEILVRPLQLNLTVAANDYEEFLQRYPNVTLREMDSRIARKAAEIRAREGFPVADSIHLATALEAKAAAFLTNDRRLARFSGIPVRIIDDFR